MPIDPPQEIKDVLIQMDRSNEFFRPIDAYKKIKDVYPITNDTPSGIRRNVLAETSAFYFMENSFGEKSNWATHFGPLMSGVTTNGKEVFVPDIAELNEEELLYWEKRSKEAEHPVLKARYSDLVWDLKKVTVGEKPAIEFAQSAIDSYLNAAERVNGKNSYDGFLGLARALEISLSIKNEIKIQEVKEELIEFIKKWATIHNIGTWSFFEELLKNKSIVLSGKEEKGVIEFLEKLLKDSSSQDKPEWFNPHAAERAAKILAWYYEKQKNKDQADRVIQTYGGAFESISNSAGAIVSISWLQKVAEEYRKKGLKDDVERVLSTIKEKGRHIEKEMKTIEAKIEIPQKDLEQFVRRIVSADLNESLGRLVRQFLPQANDALERVNNQAQSSPFQSLVSIKIIDEDQPVSTIGSVQDDMYGRVLYEISQTIDFSSPFLTLVIDELRAKFELSDENIIPSIEKSPIFDPEREGLIREGVRAYLEKDYVKAVHVLIPQIEHAIRLLLPLLDIPTNKLGRDGEFQEKNLNDILNEPRIKLVFAEDVRLFLITFLADSRGKNIRNKLSHGLLAPEAFNRFLADRVFHTLLLLGSLEHKKGDEETSS